jgi:hypothetical protein
MLAQLEIGTPAFRTTVSKGVVNSYYTPAGPFGSFAEAVGQDLAQEGLYLPMWSQAACTGTFKIAT